MVIIPVVVVIGALIPFVFQDLASIGLQANLMTALNHKTNLKDQELKPN